MLDDKIDIRLKEIEERFNEYLSKVGAKIKQPTHIDKFLSITYEEMKSLTAEECDEASLLLTQQSFYLQQELNYHKSRYDWCESTLSYFIANYSTDDKFVKREDKAAKLASKNSAVKVLLRFLYESKIYVTSLEKLSELTDKIAHRYESMKYSKRKIQM